MKLSPVQLIDEFDRLFLDGPEDIPLQCRMASVHNELMQKWWHRRLSTYDIKEISLFPNIVSFIIVTYIVTLFRYFYHVI